MIPDVSRDDLMMAMRRFNTELRDSSRWRGWHAKKNNKFAIRYNDELYPVKEVIRLATGGHKKFSGGKMANDFVEQRGFEIVALHEPVTSEPSG